MLPPQPLPALLLLLTAAAATAPCGRTPPPPLPPAPDVERLFHQAPTAVLSSARARVAEAPGHWGEGATDLDLERDREE